MDRWLEKDGCIKLIIEKLESASFSNMVANKKGLPVFVGKSPLNTDEREYLIR